MGMLSPHIMESPMAKKMDNEMELGFWRGLVRRVSFSFQDLQNMMAALPQVSRHSMPEKGEEFGVHHLYASGCCDAILVGDHSRVGIVHVKL